MEMQAGVLNFTPKGKKCGKENQDAVPISLKDTMPKASATRYPTTIPSKIEASLKMPFPKVLKHITAIKVIRATSQFCQEP